MQQPLKVIVAFSALIVGFSAPEIMAQSAGNATADEAELELFAVEIKVGPKWDASKPPNEQAFFKEHSANLKRLRDAGDIVMGARYADKGLIVFSARSMAEVRVLMEQDPAMTAGTFVYEVHVFNVFYPGLVQARSTQ